MIFVTVGTHEQSFNRLVAKVDLLKKNGIIQDKVVVQSGYSTFKCEFCKQFKMLPYQSMVNYMKMSNIIITHGGPSSFLLALSIGKIPIVVPRRKEFNEHINNHQVNFVHEIVQRDNSIIPVYNIDDLGYTIKNYFKLSQDMGKNVSSNNIRFNRKLSNIISELFKKD